MTGPVPIVKRVTTCSSVGDDSNASYPTTLSKWRIIRCRDFCCVHEIAAVHHLRRDLVAANILRRYCWARLSGRRLCERWLWSVPHLTGHHSGLASDADSLKPTSLIIDEGTLTHDVNENHFFFKKNQTNLIWNYFFFWFSFYIVLMLCSRIVARFRFLKI